MHWFFGRTWRTFHYHMWHNFHQCVVHKNDILKTKLHPNYKNTSETRDVIINCTMFSYILSLKSIILLTCQSQPYAWSIFSMLSVSLLQFATSMASRIHHCMGTIGKLPSTFLASTYWSHPFSMMIAFAMQ